MRIEQTIFVERDSQRSIVLGKGGQMIKQLSSEARRELAEILEQPSAPVPVRQGAPRLGKRSGTLPADGADVSQSLKPAGRKPLQWNGRMKG